jgi:ketosteroid isomerase-like protein
MLLATVMPSFSMHAVTMAATRAVTDEDNIRQLEREWDEAVRVRNAYALSRILADTYTLVDVNGTVMSKADYLMSIVKTPGRVTSTISEELNVVVTGDKATVTGRSSLRGRPRGRAQLGSDVQEFTNRWTKVNGAWQAVATTMLQTP